MLIYPNVDCILIPDHTLADLLIVMITISQNTSSGADMTSTTIRLQASKLGGSFVRVTLSLASPLSRVVRYVCFQGDIACRFVRSLLSLA